jgi:hypothetical protein
MLTHKRLLSVMVGGHFTDGSGKLGHLDFALVVTLEASEHHLALAGLEAVHHARDRTLVVQVGEENQLFVDEVLMVSIENVKDKWQKHQLNKSFKNYKETNLVTNGLGVLLVEIDFRQSELLPALALLHPVGQPVLTLINGLLTECHRDCVIVLKKEKLALNIDSTFAIPSKAKKPIYNLNHL